MALQSSRRDTAPSSEKAAAPTRGETAALTRSDAAAPSRGEAAAPSRCEAAAPKRGEAATSWIDAVKAWADEPDDGLPPIPSSWLEVDIPTKGPDPELPPTAPERGGEHGASSRYERGESSAQGAARGKARASPERVVTCPICQMDISSWTLADRENHPDQCLERCLEGPPVQPRATATPPDDGTAAVPWTVVTRRRAPPRSSGERRRVYHAMYTPREPPARRAAAAKATCVCG